MALNMPVFYKRTASAIVFAAIMLMGLLTGMESFLVLTLVISILCLREYFKLIQKISGGAGIPAWLAIAIYLLNIFFILLAYASRDKELHSVLYNNISTLGYFVLVVPAVLLMIATLSKKELLVEYMQTVLGLFYITIPMMALQKMEQVNMILPIALILMIWTNDTMAYLVGSFIGKTPFSPISPKKTWEGTGGGALLTMIGAMVYGYLSHKFRLVDWAVLGLCAAVAGTLGDLVESKLKRMADVKDSGNIMPGHGGALDRFDSLLLAAPFAGCYVMLFM